MAAYRVIATGIHPAILSVNRETYSEASRIMYPENRFKFSSRSRNPWYPANEAAIPFLESLSEDSRRLIKHIEYVCVVVNWVPTSTGGTITAMNQRVFKETCDYLCQNLQLKHVVLKLLQIFTAYVIKPASFKYVLLDVHGKTWEQHLVPLVRGLDTCELITRTRDGPEIIETVWEYLTSKMPRTSRPTFSSRTY